MDNDIFATFHSSRPNLAILISYYNIKIEQYRILLLVRNLDEYTTIEPMKNVSEIFKVKDSMLNDKEKQIKLALKGFPTNSKINIIKNTTINYETSLRDTKKSITLFLSEALGKQFIPQQFYLEESTTRKPMENYMSGIGYLETDISKMKVDDRNLEMISIEDILLKNMKIENNLLRVNAYNFSDYVDRIKMDRNDLLKENEKKLFKFLQNYWTKLVVDEYNEISYRFKNDDFSIDFRERSLQDLSDYQKVSKQEADFNELFWKATIEPSLFKNVGIYFNSFILENKDNYRESKIDLYSIFKYFELDDSIPFARYSYGGQVGQKMVKIYENFFSIDKIHYLEKWNQMVSYRDIPANCIQWKGFFVNEDESLEYEIILYQDGLYQIRLYQQKINLNKVQTFLDHLSNNILQKIKVILHSIGIEFTIQKIELGKNIHFVYSKLEINVQLKQDIELGKLQSLLNKSTFVFSKAGDLVSNEFINLEFKKVNNYTQTDQIQKYINHYIIQNRITDKNDLSPVVKQVMAKYGKSQIEATQIVKTWVSKFVDSENQYANKIKIGRNIGLELVGKQINTTSCNFYMSNITELEDIYTFFYYLIVLVNISQLKDNVSIYNDILGKRVDERLLAKLENNKEKEQIVETDALADLDDLVFEDPTEDQYIFDAVDPIDDIMSVHSPEEDELVAVEKKDEEIELPSEEVIDELEPITNGSSYYIKRLQLMDKEVYDYKVDSKYKPYSKKAMPNDSRQPIVLTNRQMDKVKAKYGEDTDVYGGLNRRIDIYSKSSKDYKAPSYSIKYRNLHYICPKVWCMLDQMPYYMDQLLEPGSKTGFATIGFNDKGEYLVNPTKVKCPDCKNGVWGYDKAGTLLIAQDNLKRQPYPGFFTADQHPKNICMVSCFKTPQKKVQECLATDVPVKKEKKISNEKYILKGDKYGICMNGRFCVLPDKIHNWINADFGNYKLERTIVDEFSSYLRRGILKEDEEYYQSFEKTIQYLLGDSIYKLSREQFREYLVTRLKSIPDIQKIFKKVRKGSLYLFFGDLEKYYDYILQTISLQPRFILPLLSYPSVITDNGIHFYIIKEESEKIYLECEYFDYAYSSDYESSDHIFIYSHSLGESYKKIYYEPIVLVQQKSKMLQITRSIIGVNRVVSDLLKFVQLECIEKEDPWITEIKKTISGSKKGMAEQEYFVTKQDTDRTLEALENSSDFQIVLQYTNEYNQTEGLIVRWNENNMKFYLPITPISILDNIRIIRNKKIIQLQTIDNTRNFLQSLSDKTKLLYSPYFYTKNSDGLISGIYTISGQWVPVLYADPETTKTESLNEWKYPKDIWSQIVYEKDERIHRKALRDTKKFNYEKLRFELSSWIQKDDDFKGILVDTIRKYRANLSIQEKQTIRRDLINLLSDYLRGNLVSPGVIGEWNMKDILGYCRDNRTIETCTNDKMCGWNADNNECKMIVNPEWYWKYVSRIVDELLTNINKRKEIIEEYRKELELPQNEVFFYSKEEIDDYLLSYDFNLENKKYVQHPLEHFDYTNPSKHLTEDYIQTKISEKMYTLPKYLASLFGTKSKEIGIYSGREMNSNYFFNNLNYISNTLSKKPLPVRIELANRIRRESNGQLLLDRYKSLSDVEGGEMYRKFKAMKTIEALADYVKESSWGSMIDLELLAEVWIPYKIRFILIEDNNSTKSIPYIHLPDHLKEMNKQNAEEYKFVIFILHDNRYELVIHKSNPIFSAFEIPFMEDWIEKQREFEQSMPY